MTVSKIATWIIDIMSDGQVVMRFTPAVAPTEAKNRSPVVKAAPKQQYPKTIVRHGVPDQSVRAEEIIKIVGKYPGISSRAVMRKLKKRWKKVHPSTFSSQMGRMSRPGDHEARLTRIQNAGGREHRWWLRNVKAPELNHD